MQKKVKYDFYTFWFVIELQKLYYVILTRIFNFKIANEY